MLQIKVLFPKFTKKINQLLQREVFTFSNHSSKFIENVTNQIIQNRKNKIQVISKTIFLSMENKKFNPSFI